MFTRICITTSTPVLATAARAIEHLAGWICEPRSELALSPLMCLGFERQADALLIAAGPDFRAGVVNEVLEYARCDGLVITCGMGAASNVGAHLALWEKRQTRWIGPLGFWASSSDRLWLAPTFNTGETEIAIPLGKHRLSVAVRPWASDADAQMGYRRANGLIRKQMEARR